MLLSLKISDFRGIAEFHAEPNGKSLTLRGPNGAGRAALEAFAHEHGVQLISEIVSDGKQLEAVIEDGGNEEAQPDLF